MSTMLHPGTFKTEDALECRDRQNRLKRMDASSVHRRHDGHLLPAELFKPPSLPAECAFYDSISPPERASYRACRKCGGVPSQADDRHLASVQRCCREIEAAERHAPSLDSWPGDGCQPASPAPGLQENHGDHPRQYWDSLRLRRLKDNLKAGEPVAPALYGAGYGSSSRLYEEIRRPIGHDARRSYGAGRGRGGHRFRREPADWGWFLSAPPTRASASSPSAMTRRRSPMNWRTISRRPERHRDDEDWAGMLDAVIAHLEGRRDRTCGFPWISGQPRSSGRSGRRWATFLTAKPGPMPSSPPRSANQRAACR